MKKKISVFILTLLLTFNFTFGKTQEVKAEVITLSTIAICSAILLGAGVVYQNRFELYKMAQEYADELANFSGALTQTTKGIVVGTMAFTALQSYLTKKALNPITNATIQEKLITNGISIWNISKSNPAQLQYRSFPYTPNTIINFKTTYTGTSGKTVVKSSSYNLSNYTSATNLKISPYITADKTQMNWEIRTSTGSYVTGGMALSPWVEDNDYSVCIDFQIPTLNVTQDQSISIDYTGALTNATEEKAKATIPVGSVVTPKPYDVPTDLSQPVPTVGDVVDVVPGVDTGELDMDIPNVQDTIKNKFDNPRFDKTWKAIEDMDTSRGAPPKVTFNLAKLYNAATSRFGSPTNPFQDREYTLIDFGMLQDYSFSGYPLIDYFRGIVGMGFIITTFMYVWRKLTPDNVLGD